MYENNDYEMYQLLEDAGYETSEDNLEILKENVLYEAISDIQYAYGLDDYETEVLEEGLWNAIGNKITGARKMMDKRKDNRNAANVQKLLAQNQYGKGTTDYKKRMVEIKDARAAQNKKDRTAIRGLTRNLTAAQNENRRFQGKVNRLAARGADVNPLLATQANYRQRESKANTALRNY